MDNKLSELSKPVAWKIHNDDHYFLEMREEEAEAHGRMGKKGDAIYSQEYVSALKHESAVNWETAASLNVENQDLKKRIAELERITEGVDQLAIDGGWTARGMSEYAKSLERRLTTPVRLPTTSGRVGVAYTRVIPEVIEAIRAAGFTVEGDE